MKTRFLFIFSSPPHANLHVQEMLDMTLTAAAFDQQVSILLIDDGIYALKSEQKPSTIDSKDIGPVFESLSLYDIEYIYVETESMTERGISVGDLLLPVQCLQRSDVGSLMKRQNVVVNV